MEKPVPEDTDTDSSPSSSQETDDSKAAPRKLPSVEHMKRLEVFIGEFAADCKLVQKFDDKIVELRRLQKKGFNSVCLVNRPHK